MAGQVIRNQKVEVKIHQNGIKKQPDQLIGYRKPPIIAFLKPIKHHHAKQHQPEQCVIHWPQI